MTNPSEQSIEAYVMENIADYTTHKGVWREHIAQLNQIVDKATRAAVQTERQRLYRLCPEDEEIESLIKKTAGGGGHEDWFMELQAGIKNLMEGQRK